MSGIPATQFFDRLGDDPRERVKVDIESASELVAHIEQRISTGALVGGDRLPSVRDAAANLGLAPNTVAAAYRRLRERSVVIGRGRQGTLVSPTMARRRSTTTPLPDDVIDAMSGNPDPALLPPLDNALSAALAGPRANYGSAMITTDMAAAARAWLEVDAIPTEAITLTSGAMDAVERVLVEHLRPGDLVGIEDPGHVPVVEVVTALGLVPVPMTVDPDGVTPSALAEALDRGARAIIITPRAHNPTGAAVTATRASHLAVELARHPDVLVIEDDHAGAVSGVPLAPLPRNRARWVLVRSVAKSLGPDLRLAVLAGDPDTVAAVEARYRAGPGWVSHLLQATVAHLLCDAGARALVDQAAATYERRRHRLIDALAVEGIEATGESGLQVWIPVEDEQVVADAVRDAGIAIRVGSAYRHSTPPAVRVTVACLNDEQIDRVAERLISIMRGNQAVRTARV